ncbi:hypothetical protein AB5N19_04995 [Seiridium cardinale]
MSKSSDSADFLSPAAVKDKVRSTRAATQENSLETPLLPKLSASSLARPCRLIEAEDASMSKPLALADPVGLNLQKKLAAGP